MFRHTNLKATIANLMLLVALSTAISASANAETKSADAGATLPANAYASTANYGRNWECVRGYDRDGQTCVAIEIPDHANLNAYGSQWQCERTYKRVNNECVAISVPEHGYLIDLDLSRNCAASLNTYRVAKERRHGITTFSGIPGRSGSACADQRARTQADR